MSRHPGARLLIVGFGGLRRCPRGVAERPRRAATSGRCASSPSTGAGSRRARTSGSRCSRRSSSALPEGYEDAARAAAGSVAFSGRLEHDEVAVPVAASDALVFPSTFPEAFGMVAAEAASAGALPVSAAHSGAAEVSQALAADLPDGRQGAGLVRAQRRRGGGDRRAPQRLARARPARTASRRASPCAGRSSGCGAGSRSRGRARGVRGRARRAAGAEGRLAVLARRRPPGAVPARPATEESGSGVSPGRFM